MSKIYPVIMSGGAGTRLWPLSKKEKPKQYHALVSENTMFAETLMRLKQYNRENVAAPIIICAKGHEDLVAQQSQDCGVELTAIILEPSAQNTAAVGAVAAHYVNQTDPEGQILLLPADHHITDTDGFWVAVDEAHAIAKDGYLATFGIQPTGPETGFGYIENGNHISGNIYKIKSFKEKPDTNTAQTYIDTGRYSWNAGIFLFNTQRLISDYKTYAKDIYDPGCLSLDKAETKGLCVYLDAATFTTVRSEPIDISIMENTDHAIVAKGVDIGWNDIGSWSAVLDFLSEAKGDDCISAGDVKIINSKNTLVKSDGKFVAAIGVEDLIIISTDDVVLVLNKSQSQNVKQITNYLKENKRNTLV